MNEKTRTNAALALDLTHDVGERGPKTMLARQRLAEWLDTGRGSVSAVKADIAWLKKVAR